MNLHKVAAKAGGYVDSNESVPTKRLTASLVKENAFICSNKILKVHAQDLELWPTMLPYASPNFRVHYS